MKKKLGVIFGGQSTEHEVSIMSAKNVLDNLDSSKYDIYPIFIDRDANWFSANLDREKEVLITNIIDYLKDLDIVFPVLHGKYGEDGAIQGLLELFKIPYVGCKVLASSMCMDKAYTKIVLEKAGIRQANYVYLKALKDSYYVFSKKMDAVELSMEDIVGKIELQLGYPVFVKPSNSGSSVGVCKARNQEELENAIKEAAKFDTKILIEEQLVGKEVECAVLGNMDVKATTVGEVLSAEEFYTYEAKYENEDSRTLIPATISEEMGQKISEIAIRVFKALDGAGLARVDFFVNEETEQIYLNEINTMPGFTSISMYPQLWKHCGLSYTKLLDNLISLGLEEDN